MVVYLVSIVWYYIYLNVLVAIILRLAWTFRLTYVTTILKICLVLVEGIIYI